VKRFRLLTVALGSVCLLGGARSTASTRMDTAHMNTATTHASGTFDVKVTPLTSEYPVLSRMDIDKQFHGDIEGTSRGQMIAASTDVKDSAVYVALEKVTGTVHGKRGTFLLQHSGVMTRGVPHLTVTVVPDSGTDQLIGLAGQMTIKIEGGKHFYEFDYTLGSDK
jgi:hypothetical protein